MDSAFSSTTATAVAALSQVAADISSKGTHKEEIVMASAAAVRAISAIVTAAVVIASGRPGWTLEFLVTEIRTLPGRVG